MSVRIQVTDGGGLDQDLSSGIGKQGLNSGCYFHQDLWGAKGREPSRMAPRYLEESGRMELTEGRRLRARVWKRYQQLCCGHTYHTKTPTYEHSSCELSKTRMCIRMSNHVLVHVSGVHCHMQLALCLLLLTILQLYHLPPPLPPPVSNSSCLFTGCQPLDASCCTVLLYFPRDCTVRLKVFSLFFVFVCFSCIICVKSIINLLQYSTI